MKAQKEYADTYFFGFFYYALTWTLLPTTGCTKVLLISRLGSRHGHKHSYRRFYDLLRRFGPHLSTPHVPLLAITIDAMLCNDERLHRSVNEIVKIDENTKFSWHGVIAPTLDFDVKYLAEWSRISSSIRICIIGLLRQHENGIRALDTIREMYAEGSSKIPVAKIQEDYDRSIMEILDLIDILTMRADSFVPYATYTQKRVDVQINVVRSTNDKHYLFLEISNEINLLDFLPPHP